MWQVSFRSHNKAQQKWLVDFKPIKICKIVQTQPWFV